MAGRTCLLCGKALSRIWADKGEEFCSREHRNQYRLRRGMDRLMEASAVASVMRRREAPKTIPVENLRSAAPATPRGFLEARCKPPADVSIPKSALQGRPRLNGASRFRVTRALADFEAEMREIPGSMRFPGPPAHTPRASIKLSAHVMPAPPAPTRPRRGAPAGNRSESIRWHKEAKPTILALIARSASRAASVMPEPRPARRLGAPSLGRALRVSTAAGFRLPERPAVSPRFAGPEVQGLPETNVRRMAALTPPGKSSPKQLAIEIAPSLMQIPPAPPADFQRTFRWPGVFDIPLEFRDASNATRPLAVPFRPLEESAKERK
jgi:hypothetical protein